MKTQLHTEVKITIRKVSRRLGTSFRQAKSLVSFVLERMLHVCGDDLRGTRNKMILLFAYTTLRRSLELTSLGMDLTLSGDGRDFIFLRQSKTDRTRDGVQLTLDIKMTSPVKNWIDSAGIGDGDMFRGNTGK